MRGRDQSSGNLFSYVDLEERVPDDHPLRLIREIVNDVLGSLSSEFETLYSHMGRPSIPPEKLLRALLLQAFYSIRSERQLMEQLNFNMLFRWFVGLGLDDGVWDASAFCHNRDRLLEAEVSAQLLAGVIQHHKVGGLLSRDHFSVDGTLIEAWASMKSFRPKGEDDGDGGSGRNAERDFHGEKRSNATHASTTDPDARLYRKGNGRESKLCYMGHALLIDTWAARSQTTMPERDKARSLRQILVRNAGITLGGARDGGAFEPCAGCASPLTREPMQPRLAHGRIIRRSR